MTALAWLSAVSYGDRRSLANTLHSLRRRPARGVLWAIYAFAIVAAVLGKTLPQHTQLAPRVVQAANDLWICALGVAFAVVLVTGGSRWLGVFSSRAEALLLVRGGIPLLVVAAYLQGRAVLAMLLRGFGRFSYLFLIVIPSGITLQLLAAEVAFFAAASTAIASIALPRALARGIVRRALMACGVLLFLAAAIPLLHDALGIVPLPEFAWLPPLLPQYHPGTALVALAGGDLRAVWLAAAVAVCASGAFVFAARDAYPELYAISLAHFDWRAAKLERGTGPDAATSARAARRLRTSTTPRTSGALALLWADSLSFTRSVSPLFTATTALLAIAVGAGLALFVRHVPWTATMAGWMVPGYAIAISTTTTMRLTPALRMPLFWLGPTPLAARLAAWLLGPFLRDVALFGLAILGYALVRHGTEGPILTFIGAASLLALSRAVGLGIFAIFPNPVDQAGPAVMLRGFVTVTLLAPVMVAGLFGLAVSPAPFVSGVLVASATAWLESIGLILFAGRRLVGSVDRLSAR